MHVIKIPTRRGPCLTVKVSALEKWMAQYWHARYQDAIERQGRADASWDWEGILEWVMPIIDILRQSPHCYCLGVKDGDGLFVPAGMLMLVGNYPALNEREKRAVFAWFLAAAPAAELAQNLAGEEVCGIGRSLVDIALTHSVCIGREGRLGLHADPLGGENLMSYYTKIGLVNLPRDRRMGGLRGLLLKNDGRYFFADPDTAIRIRDSLREYRR